MNETQIQEYYRMKQNYDTYKEGYERQDKSLKAFMKSLGKSRCLRIMKECGFITIDYVTNKVEVAQ